MVSIYNFENTGRELKPDHLICCINVFIEEAGFFSMNDSGEKGCKLTEQILFNFLALLTRLYWPISCDAHWKLPKSTLRPKFFY